MDECASELKVSEQAEGGSQSQHANDVLDRQTLSGLDENTRSDNRATRQPTKCRSAARLTQVRRFSSRREGHPRRFVETRAASCLPAMRFCASDRKLPCRRDKAVATYSVKSIDKRAEN